MWRNVYYACLLAVFECHGDTFVWCVGVVFVLVFWGFRHYDGVSPSSPVVFLFVDLPVWFSWVSFWFVAYGIGRVVATVDVVEAHGGCSFSGCGIRGFCVEKVA